MMWKVQEGEEGQKEHDSQIWQSGRGLGLRLDACVREAI